MCCVQLLVRCISYDALHLLTFELCQKSYLLDSDIYVRFYRHSDMGIFGLLQIINVTATDYDVRWLTSEQLLRLCHDYGTFLDRQ